MKILACLVLFASVPSAFAQFMLPPAKEMKNLGWLNGEWKGEIKYSMPGMAATYSSKMRFEDTNRSLHKKLIYTIDMGKNGQYEGTTYITWMPKDKAFKAWTFENMVSEPRIETAPLEDGKLVLTSEPHGGTVVTRMSSAKVSENEFSFTIEMKQGEKWSPVGAAKYKKS